jgi:hypothetical protein
VKTPKKFVENCLPVESKKKNVVGGCLPLICTVLALWLIPVALKNNIKSAFAYVQVPIYSSTLRVDSMANAIRTNTLPRRKLVAFCEDLIRTNLRLELALATAKERSSGTHGREGSPKIGNFALKPARVIRRDEATWTNELLINIGSFHGIAPGMGVIAGNHAIGRIKSVQNRTSTVELITSTQFRMIVHALEDDGAAPIIFAGNERSTLNVALGKATNIPMELAQDSEKIVLVTSELAGIFPKNLTVGTIHASELTGEHLLSANVALNNRLLARISEVAVLVNLEDQP